MIAPAGAARRPAGIDLALVIAVAAIAVAVVLAVAKVVRDGLPPSRTALPTQTLELAALVPARTLAYVQLSLDDRRDEVAAIEATLRRFPGAAAARRRVIGALTAPDCARSSAALRTAHDAALALFETGAGSGSATAGSLLILDGARPPQGDPGGRRPCGALVSEYRGDRLLVGQQASLAAAAALTREGARGRSLADAPVARGRLLALPADRVAAGWLSRDGVRRLLEPRGGAVGLVAGLLDQPALRGLSFSISPRDGAVAVRVASALDAATVRRLGAPQAIDSRVAELIPDGVLGAIVTARLDRAFARLRAAGGGIATPSAAILGQLPAEVRALLGGTSAAFLLPAGRQAPTLAIVTPVRDEAAARRALTRMPARLRRVFVSDVRDGRLVLATGRRGLTASARGSSRLTSSTRWREVVGDAGGHPVTSLFFLDFRKLLTLAEQAGLGGDPAYRSVRADLDRVTAVGGRMRAAATESTLDLTFSLTP